MPKLNECAPGLWPPKWISGLKPGRKHPNDRQVEFCKDALIKNVIELGYGQIAVRLDVRHPEFEEFVTGRITIPSLGPADKDARVAARKRLAHNLSEAARAFIGRTVEHLGNEVEIEPILETSL